MDEKEEYNMSGELGATQAATLALLSDTARAGNRGYGYGGGEGGFGGGMMFPGNSMLAAGAHADGTATKEAIDCGIRQFDAGLSRVSDQAEESRRQASFTALLDGQFRAELRTNDRLNAMEAQRSRDLLQITRDQNDARAEAAKCCCDLKLENCKNTSDIMAQIAASESRAVERSLNAANAELTALKTQIACGCCPPRCTPVS